MCRWVAYDNVSGFYPHLLNFIVLLTNTSFASSVVTATTAATNHSDFTPACTLPILKGTVRLPLYVGRNVTLSTLKTVLECSIASCEGNLSSTVANFLPLLTNTAFYISGLKHFSILSSIITSIIRVAISCFRCTTRLEVLPSMVSSGECTLFVVPSFCSYFVLSLIIVSSVLNHFMSKVNITVAAATAA